RVTGADIRGYYHIAIERLFDGSFPDDDLESLDISGLSLTLVDMAYCVAQASRRSARKAAKSASEMRTRPPIRWTGRARALIQRRTVRSHTLRRSATSAIVKKVVALPVTSERHARLPP